MLVTVLRYVLTVYSHLRKMNTPSDETLHDFFFRIEIEKIRAKYVGINVIF